MVGEQKFYSSKEYQYLKDVPVPPCFIYIFNIFIELYNNSGENGITWQDISSYSQMRKIELSQQEIDCIMKCKHWANSEIKKLEAEE